MRNTLLFLLFLLMIITKGQSQNSFVHPDYIRVFPHDLQVSVFSKYTLDKSSINADNSRYYYQSQNLSPSFRLQYGKWGFGFQLPVNFLRQAKRQSSTLGIQIQAFPSSMIINAGISRLKGYYQNDPELQELTTINNPLVWRLFFNPLYVFNGKKFSMSSLFQLDRIQLQSQGTPLAGIRLDYLHLKDIASQEDKNNSTLLDKYAFRQSGIEFGYAYTYVLSEKYFVAAFLKGDFSQTKFQYKREGVNPNFSKWSFTPINEFFLTLGYQTDQFFSSIQLTNRKQSITSGEIEVENKALTVQLLVGFRFYRPGLERRVLAKVKKWRE